MTNDQEVLIMQRATLASQEEVIKIKDKEIKRLKERLEKVEHIVMEPKLDSKTYEEWYEDKKEKLILTYQEQITDLQEQLEILRRKFVYPGLNCATFEETLKNSWSTQTLEYYVEAMCAAYMKLCNKPPDKAVLNICPSEDNKGLLYWFSDKKEAVEGFRIYDQISNIKTCDKSE